MTSKAPAVATHVKESSRRISKGCIRFTNPEKLDFEVLGLLLRRNVGPDAEAF